MKKFTLSFFVFHFSFFTFHLSEAQILRVPSEYQTIQAAVDAAGYGDTVLVSPGTYLENVLIQGNAKTITLASNFIFSGDTNDINNTIIDASQPQNPNNGMGILLKNQDTTLMPKITGFTITGGTGYYKTYGGGIYSSNAIPVIEYNHIQNCSVTGTQPNGGGIYVGGGNPNTLCVINHNVIKNCLVTAGLNGVEANGGGISLTNVKAIVEDNTITGNIITGNSSANSYGGGIFYNSTIPLLFLSYVKIVNNEITDNTIQSWQANGGGVCLMDNNGYTTDTIEGNTINNNVVSVMGSSGYAIGGGIILFNPKEGSVISNNIISENRAVDGPPGSDCWGGGIYLYRNPSLFLENNSIIKNNRITGNEATEGAGLCFQSSGARLVNNFISDNHAEKSGGAIYFQGPASISIIAEVINNTITENSANGPEGDAGSIYFNGTMAVMLMNNLFYGNEAINSDELVINASTIQMNNCDINTDEVTGTWTGENNFYADPEFIDEMSWDCWTMEAPCSNAGIDQIFVFYQWFEAPAEDIMNNERPQDDFIDVGAVEVNMCYVGYPEAVVSRQSSVSSYPNPTGGIVDFRFSIFDGGRVTLKIFDVQGREMAVVLDEDKTDGEHTIRWNAERIPAGIYYYSLRSGKQVQTGKIIVVK